MSQIRTITDSYWSFHVGCISVNPSELRVQTVYKHQIDGNWSRWFEQHPIIMYDVQAYWVLNVREDALPPDFLVLMRKYRIDFMGLFAAGLVPANPDTVIYQTQVQKLCKNSMVMGNIPQLDMVQLPIIPYKKYISKLKSK